MILKKITTYIEKNNFLLIILAISIFGLILRLFGIDWDNGLLFHPDERQLLILSTQIDFSNLDPNWYNYGPLPLYLLEIVTFGADLSAYDLRIFARALSACFDSISIILIGLIGNKFYSKSTGIISSLLYSGCVLSIQTSHFFTVDTFLVTAILGTFLIISYLDSKVNYKKIILLGIISAAGMSIKVSYLPMMGIIMISLFLNYKELMFSFTIKNLKILKIGLSFLISFFISYFIFNPYSLINYSEFISASSIQSGMARGILDFPYTRQYIDTSPYIYHLAQLVKVSLGPVLGVIGFLGTIFVLFKTSKNSNILWLILLIWLVGYFSFFGIIHTKFIRYMLPIIPVIIIFASYFLIYIFNNYFSNFKKYKFIIIGILILFSFHYTFSFINLYKVDHPANIASNYISNNFKNNSIIIKEHWDESVPLGPNYKIIELPMYDPDSSIKIRDISEKLSSSDGLYITSKRLFSTIPRLEERYPFSSNYYRNLFNGELGFSLTASYIQYPSLFGFSYISDPFQRIPNLNYKNNTLNEKGINMGWTDESFSVYDHPEIFIFKNTKKLNSEELFNIITTINHNSNYSKIISKNESESLYGKPYKGLFSSSNSTNSFFIWYIFIQVISIILLPIIWILLKETNFSIPGSIKLLSILLISFIYWILLSLKIVNFNAINIYFITMILGIISILIIYFNKKTFFYFLKKNKNKFLRYEFIFFIGLLIFALIKSFNPDLWHPYRGGEKPMEFAYINAILNSNYMPPYDPWFSGGVQNYYYFGFFIFSFLINISQISPFIGFNLSIATLFAMSITSLYGLSKILSKKSMLLPFIMIFSTIIFGNFQSLLQVLKWSWGDKVFNIFKIDFWQPSRIISNSEGYEITEFPYFSFIFSDLHPHLISIPITILGINFLISSFHKKNYKLASLYKFLIPVSLVNSFILGTLWVTNTWSVPLQIFLSFLLSLLFFNYKKDVLSSLKYSLSFTITCVVIAYILFMPFHINFSSPFSGFELSIYTTKLKDFIEIYYFGVFILLVFLFISILDFYKSKKYEINTTIYLFITPIIISTGIYFLTQQLLLSILIFLIILLIISLFNTNKETHSGFYTRQIILLLISSFGIALFVELFTLKNDIGRMNTFFKFHLQVWILLSISSSYLFIKILQELKTNLVKNIFIFIITILSLIGLIYPILGTLDRTKDRFISTRLSLDGSLYGSYATYNSPKGKIVLKDDFEAIFWMKENLNQTVIIAEGLSPLYSWSNRFSIYSGFPSVIGWDWHQTQQREYNRSLINERKNDINELYSSDYIDTKLKIINKYDIDLIIIGTLEKLYYPKNGINSFEVLEQKNILSKLYSNKNVIIYKVGDFNYE